MTQFSPNYNRILGRRPNEIEEDQYAIFEDFHSRKPNIDRSVEAELWRRGDLRFLLEPYNIPIYEAIHSYVEDPACTTFVIEASRGWSKSFTSLLVAVELCIRNPGYIARFTTGFVSDLKKIIRPLLRILFQSCPKDIMPRYNGAEGVYYFPHNGAELHLHGTDNLNAKKMRGLRANFLIDDEAGTMNELEHLVRDVQGEIVDRCEGTLGLISTAPEDADHDFYIFQQEAKEQGYYLLKTIYDHPVWTQKDYDRKAKRAGGYDTVAFKREHLCERISEVTRTIFPEWDEKYIITEDNDPRDEFYKYYHKYESMDMGFKNDKTAVLLGYYHFRKAALIIEDEIVAPGYELVTNILAGKLKAKEKELWSNEMGTIYPIFRRISDNNEPRFNDDMSRFHDIHFTRTSKDSLHAMVNEVKIWLQQGRIRVHPRCEQLIGCLQYGIWDKRRKKFDTSKKYGHYDALAALIYLVRNIDEASNPVPKDYLFDPEKQFATPGTFNKALTGTEEVLRSLFSRRRR